MPKIMITEEWVDDEAIYIERVADETEEDANIFEVTQAEFDLIMTAKQMNLLVEEYLRDKIKTRIMELDFPGDTFDMTEAQEVPVFTFEQVLKQCFTAPEAEVK